MTTAQLLALPEDGRERWLIRGQLPEGGPTRRTCGHGRTAARICGELGVWLRTRPAPRGELLAGDAGIRLRRDPDTTVGVDVAFISAATAAGNLDTHALVDGPLVLAVEILSPSDRHGDVAERVVAYLEAGAKFVWVVDPDLCTITVYRPDAEPQLFNRGQTICGAPHLPGLRVALADIFLRR